MSVGTYWQNKFVLKLTPIMYDITVYRYEAAPTDCPGAFAEDSHEYDSEADIAYHIANPSAPACVNGVVGTLLSVESKGFLFTELNESQMSRLNFGTLDENEAVVIFAGTVDLTNIVSIQYPVGTFYEFIYKRDLSIADTVIAQYGKVRVSPSIL